MKEPVTAARCLAVAGVASALLVALLAFLLPDLAAGLATVGSGGAAVISFDELLVDGCAVAALLAAAWLWVVTVAVALAAARGRADTAIRGVPAVLRRLVLSACGAALVGAAAVPAHAAPGLGGLPMPDRATGGVSTAVSATTPGPRLAQDAAHAPTGLGARVVVVRPGDTLWGLAVRHLPPDAAAAEVTACWHRIHELNRDVIGDDPDLIHPEQRLRLPRR